MNMRFASTCAGYFGELVSRQSLNSRFIAIVLNNPEILRNSLPFPQRIPRGGYLEEICNVQENPREARAQISLIITQLVNEVKKLDLTRDSNDSIYYLNLVKMLLRYSQLGFVKNLNASWLSPALQLDFEVQKATAESSERLNFELPPDIDRLHRVYKQASAVEGELGVPALLPLTRLVVAIYRYDQHSVLRKDLALLAKEALARYREAETTTLNDAICLSYMFRGIAMVTEHGPEFVRECMFHALKIADSIEARDETEALVKAENRYTCLQSVTKMKTGDYEGAKEALLNMIATDPHDPVAYLEYGLLEKRNHKITSASDSFLSAARLGPPGMAMNLFFAGQCFAVLGRVEEAKSSFYESAQLDPTALSPWIELAELLQDKELFRDELRSVLSQIVNVDSRFSQLETDEKDHFKNWLHTL